MKDTILMSLVGIGLAMMFIGIIIVSVTAQSSTDQIMNRYEKCMEYGQANADNCYKLANPTQ